MTTIEVEAEEWDALNACAEMLRKARQVDYGFVAYIDGDVPLDKLDAIRARRASQFAAQSCTCTFGGDGVAARAVQAACPMHGTGTEGRR